MPTEQEGVKLALKEALKEWLDEKYAEIGKWTLHGLLAAGVVALAYFILTTNGWHPAALKHGLP